MMRNWNCNRLFRSVSQIKTSSETVKFKFVVVVEYLDILSNPTKTASFT